MPGTARILAIDGGGIRGIVPALLIDKIEQDTGGPIHSHFDMIAGTSTGGILAAGLTAPRPNDGGGPLTAARMARLYRDDGDRIFFRSLWKGFSSLGGLTDEKYEHDNLVDILQNMFGTTPLSMCLADVMITGYELHSREPYFFKSWKAKGEHLAEGETKESRDFELWEVCRASSAAPTFFEPAAIDSEAGKDMYFVDGGVFANNPTMCAFASARKIYPNADNYLVVSLGTGSLERKIPYEDAKDWGLVGWARPVINIMLGGSAVTVHYQMQQLPNVQPYFRFDIDLLRFGDGSDGPNDDMDDASGDNIAKLERKAQEMIASEAPRIAELIGILGEPRTPRVDLI